MDLKNKDKITIQKYNNKEYDKIIEKIDEDKDEFIFSIDIFVLIFYRQNHYEKFHIIFKNIKNKQDASDYIIKHNEIFSKFSSSDLELIFNNIENFDFNKFISLASNFNEYIKFFCSKEEYIKKNKLIIKIDNYKEELDPNIDIEKLIIFIDILINLIVLFLKKKF